VSGDRYLKEDPERAEAVLTTLHLYMGISPLIAAWGEEQAYDDAEVLNPIYVIQDLPHGCVPCRPRRT
jgi:hypothetical protein